MGLQHCFLSIVTPIYHISVPSFGPMCLQQDNALEPDERSFHFSTLVRANASATNASAVGDNGTSLFQYPRSGQCVCNLAINSKGGNLNTYFSTLVRANVSATILPADETDLYEEFQYPRSGQCVCNGW